MLCQHHLTSKSIRTLVLAETTLRLCDRTTVDALIAHTNASASNTLIQILVSSHKNKSAIIDKPNCVC